MWREATNERRRHRGHHRPLRAAVGDVNSDGELVDRFHAVRKVTDGLQREPQFELRVEPVLERGDVALLLSHWTMSATAQGTPMTMQGTTTDLVRQPDGTWRFVLDNPTGIAILGPEA